MRKDKKSSYQALKEKIDETKRKYAEILERIWDIYADIMECEYRNNENEEFSKLLILGHYLEENLNELTEYTYAEYSKKRLIEAIKKEIKNEK